VMHREPCGIPIGGSAARCAQPLLGLIAALRPPRCTAGDSGAPLSLRAIYAHLGRARTQCAAAPRTPRALLVVTGPHETP